MILQKAVKSVSTMVCTIDCSAPAEDKIFDVVAFEQFLRQKIKVNGKAGALGKVVTITRDGDNVTVTSTAGFSKQYLKYLTKKFLKKNKIRDWLRVIAAKPGVYQLRYFNIQEGEEEEVEDERPEVLDVTRKDMDGEAVELKRVRLQSQVLNPANFLQETTVQEPAFEELFVLWRPKETSDSVRQLRLTGHSASKSMSNLIMVRAVKGVPMADLEIALPEKKLHMKAFDLIQLVISITMAVIALLTQLLRGLRGSNDESSSASSFVIMSAFALITKTVSTYFASMARYNSIVLSGMNARTMAADRCALTFLVDAVRAQEYAEAASALCVLLQMEEEGVSGPQEKEIADRADELISRADPDREARPVPCHLEVPDALEKLRRLGLLDNGTKLNAKGIDGITKILEKYLQKQFQSVAEGSE